ncbi:autotransporter domain-containing protein [Paraburkholderia kururiensis]|uniref:Autotransporter domain-containing protein n=1 Tax=Paraburkholderia kururiensis TaxID=984307 RepID=A0ABZ0WQM3_9BURK|nr:autotransporter domain-containing protein [Paraburkholderia kururiensis]WQD79710.1 autotransporter domain-containing protein [Paraburkholderia kururiensis]
MTRLPVLTMKTTTDTYRAGAAVPGALREFALRRHPLAAASVATFAVALHAAPASAACLSTNVNTDVIGATTCVNWSTTGNTSLVVTNSGSLSGTPTAISVSGSGTGSALSNSGVIAGTAYGVLNAGTIGTVTNHSGGTIVSAQQYAFYNDNGTVISMTNESGGSIMGSTLGIADAGLISSLTNSGVVSGNRGIETGVGGTIGTLVNNGTISGTGGSGVGIYNFFGTFGTIDNTANATISGLAYGVYNVGTIGTIANEGTLTGGIAGVLSSSGGTVGTITNSGLLQGGQQGIQGANLTITNSGTISGGTDAIYFTGGSSLLTLASGQTMVGAIELGAGASATVGGANSGLTVGNAIKLDASTSTLTLNSTGNLTLGGLISGSGNVTVGGAGTLTLAGTNTYSGTTTIGSGALQLTGDTSLMTGNIVDSGALIFGQTASSRYSGTISGAGSVTQGGTGTLTLTGAQTYTGATAINTGATLALSGSGSVAQSAGVTANGTFDISGTTGGTSIKSLSGTGSVTLGSQTLTLTDASGVFSGVISGTGGLTLAGGTETLTNVNTYTGTTLIESGAVLALSSANNIAIGNVVDFGTLQISGSAGGLSGSGTVSVGAAGLTLAGSNGTFGGVIAGGGGLTLASGTQTLTGTSTYTGTTTVAGGATLALAGTGSIAQSSGMIDNGVLDISGTAGGAQIANLSGSGTVNLGVQRLTVAGSDSTTFSGSISGTGPFVKQGTGTLILDGRSTAFTGTTEVAGGLLEVGDIGTPGALLGGSVVVDTPGTLRGHGTIAGDVTNNGTVMPGGSIGTLTVAGNYAQAGGATLSVEVSPTAASQLSVNGSAALNGVLAIAYTPGTYSARQYTLVSARSVSGTFSSITNTGTSYLGTLTPTITYSADSVLLTLSGAVAPTDTSIYTALGTAAIVGGQAQDAALLDRLGNGSAATPGAPAGWVTATGSHTKVSGTNGEPGFQANRYGFLAGLDRTLGSYTVGVAAGYDHTAVGEQDTGDSGTIDTLRVALYGARKLGPVNLAATVGAGLDFLSLKRPFGTQGTAEGDHMGQEFNFGTQASLPMTFGSVTVTPRIGLRYAYFHANGFGESGAGGQDLQVGADNVRSLQPYAQISLDRNFGDSLRPVNVELRVGYAHELLDANRAVSVASQDGTPFNAPGTTLPRGYLTSGVSVTMHPVRNLDVALSYDTVFNTTHASVQQGSVRVGYRF